MKKYLILIILVIPLSYGTALGALQILESWFAAQNGDSYFDSIGNEDEGGYNDKSLALLKRSYAKDDNLLVFGSCEMEKEDVHMAFWNKSDGFQVNKIGKIGTHTLINAISLGAIHEGLTGKKIVYLSSASFFRKEGMTQDRFDYNFSELRFYGFMFNEQLSDSLKKRLADRVVKYSEDEMYLLPHIYAMAISSENPMLRFLSQVTYPLYYLRYKTLLVRDQYAAYQKLREYRNKGLPEVIQPKITQIDWDKEKAETLKKEKQKSGNEFHVLDDWYKKRVANHQLERYKFDLSDDSPEREDFLIFLEVCKELNVVPLIVNLPHHGKLSDYFDLIYKIGNRQQRKELNHWIKQTVESYGFELADFSVHEYTDYFNSRYTTTGSYGLVYVNEAISKFYNNG